MLTMHAPALVEFPVTVTAITGGPRRAACLRNVTSKA